MRTGKNHRSRKRKLLYIPVLVIAVLCIAFLIYTEQYYHAEEAACAALRSDQSVIVRQTEYGWHFDGPSETDALIFYPGARVEETAYAPLLHRLAEQGMDACLVRMPFRLALFGVNKADQVMKQHDYRRWYICGHSLGGVMAAEYAASHGSRLSGTFLLAAYPSRKPDDSTRTWMIYGSEDSVLNMTKLEEAGRDLPESSVYVIQGGNHAQFGNYGKQAGDGEAAISSAEQQQITVEFIREAGLSLHRPAGRVQRGDMKKHDDQNGPRR